MVIENSNQPTNGTLESITESIRQIREVIDTCSTESVAGWCMTRLLIGHQTGPNLSSPAKQIFFLLGLLIESKTPSKARDLSTNEWHYVVTLLENVFATYVGSTFFNPSKLDNQLEDWGKIRQVTGTAFVAYFYQTLLASVEQVSDRIRAYVTPFDDQLETDFGIAASDALNIAEWIRDTLQKPLDDLHEGNIEEILKLGKISRSELVGRYGAKGSVFWDLFTIGRGEGELLKYPTDTSVAEARPLLRISDEEAMSFNINALFTSILVRTERTLADSATNKRYFRHRDKTIEEQAASAFLNILGDEAEIYRNLYETPDNHHEHDLVIVANDICLFVEIKASPPREPFRDPEKAFIRLRHEFRSDRGIQKAYEQARSLLRAVQTDKELVLYDKRGNSVLILPSGIADNAFCICVTRDSYGPLATYLSWLLEKDQDDPYPWSVNILDLDNIVEAWNYFGWNARQLKAYLSQRRQFHTELFSTDELDYAGAFLRHCGLQYLAHGGAFVQLGPEYSDIFDEIHAHLHYGGPAVRLNPVYPVRTDIRESFKVGEPVFVKGLPEGVINFGRNERCPCDSGVKFKRCHGK